VKLRAIEANRIVESAPWPKVFREVACNDENITTWNSRPALSHMLLPPRRRKLASAAKQAAANAQLFGCQNLFDTRWGA